MISDVRWFGDTRLTTLVVPGLRAAGVTVSMEGSEPARAVVCMSGRHLTEAWLWSRRRGVPLVFYFWDIPPWRLTGGRPDPVFDVAGRLVTIPRPFGRISRRPGHYSRVLYALKRAAAVWVASESIAELVRGVAKREPTRVPYCYDSGRFTPGPGSRDPEVIATVSRLVPYKGQQDLLRAAALLSWRPRVRIIGRGQDEGALRTLAASLDVRCTVETDVSDEGIVEAYRTAGLVVCPSHFEGFGLTGMEALGCGARVVASDIPPHREFLGHAVSYYPPGDHVALAAALEAARSPGREPPPADLRALSIATASERFANELAPILRGPR